MTLVNVPNKSKRKFFTGGCLPHLHFFSLFSRRSNANISPHQNTGPPNSGNLLCKTKVWLETKKWFLYTQARNLLTAYFRTCCQISSPPPQMTHIPECQCFWFLFTFNIKSLLKLKISTPVVKGKMRRTSIHLFERHYAFLCLQDLSKLKS